MIYDRLHPVRFKHQVAASFDRTSAGYGTPGDFHWDFARRLVDQAPLEPDQFILDVATGTAPAALIAAQRIGDQGYIVGVDLSPGILQLAKHNIRATIIPNIALVIGDAEQLPFAADCFDGIVCSSAIVWFPAISSALREWYRVIRDGGWIAFSCFGGSVHRELYRACAARGQMEPRLRAACCCLQAIVTDAEGTSDPHVLNLHGATVLPRLDPRQAPDSFCPALGVEAMTIGDNHLRERPHVTSACQR